MIRPRVGGVCGHQLESVDGRGVGDLELIDQEMFLQMIVLANGCVGRMWEGGETTWFHGQSTGESWGITRFYGGSALLDIWLFKMMSINPYRRTRSYHVTLDTYHYHIDTCHCPVNTCPIRDYIIAG